MLQKIPIGRTVRKIRICEDDKMVNITDVVRALKASQALRVVPVVPGR